MFCKKTWGTLIFFCGYILPLRHFDMSQLSIIGSSNIRNIFGKNLRQLERAIGELEFFLFALMLNLYLWFIFHRFFYTEFYCLSLGVCNSKTFLTSEHICCISLLSQTYDSYFMFDLQTLQSIFRSDRPFGTHYKFLSNFLRSIWLPHFWGDGFADF